MLKNKNRFASNAVFHALQKTGFVGAGVNGRHRVDLTEIERKKKGSEKPKGKDLFEPDADEMDASMADGDMDDRESAPRVTPAHHAKKIMKHAKNLRKIAVDIGDRVSEMHRMGLE